MPITNGSFETNGTAPGTAAGWTASYVATEEAFADFARNPSEVSTLGHEGFEVGWAGVDDQVFLPALGDETVGLEAAVFNLGPGQRPYENFDNGWGQPGFPQLELLTTDIALFHDGTPAPAALDVEAFELGWGPFRETNTSGAVVLELPAPGIAVFSGNDEERFEAGWGSPLINSLSATLGDLETFETVEGPIVVTAFATSDILEPASDPVVPFADDEAVQLASTGTLPAPLSPGVTYYLSAVLPSEFKLAMFPGGPPLDLTDSGEGVHTLTRDPALWWSLLLTVPPNGGGTYTFGFASTEIVSGVVAYSSVQTDFAPMLKGGRITGALKRGLGGGPTGFAPFLFIGLGAPNISTGCYILGLADAEPHHIELRKGTLAGGLPDAPVAPSSGNHILMRSIESFEADQWHHLRIDMIRQGSGDVLLQCYFNALEMHPASAPVWDLIPGMEGSLHPAVTGFVDDVLGVNTGSVPYTSGRAGFGFQVADTTRRVYFDHLQVGRQL